MSRPRSPPRTPPTAPGRAETDAVRPPSSPSFGTSPHPGRRPPRPAVKARYHRVRRPGDHRFGGRSESGTWSTYLPLPSMEGIRPCCRTGFRSCSAIRWPEVKGYGREHRTIHATDEGVVTLKVLCNPSSVMLPLAKGGADDAGDGGEATSLTRCQRRRATAGTCQEDAAEPAHTSPDSTRSPLRRVPAKTNAARWTLNRDVLHVRGGARRASHGSWAGELNPGARTIPAPLRRGAGPSRPVRPRSGRVGPRLDRLLEHEGPTTSPSDFFGISTDSR